MEVFWHELRHIAQQYTGRILGALVILALGMVALRYLTMPLRRLLERGQLEPATASFLTNSLRALLIVVIVIGVLQQLGVETTSLLTVLAASGLAIALSLQSALSNFTAGLILLSFRMIRVGDFIEAGALRGRVRDILPFHVVLTTDDNQTVTVPNSLLTGAGFSNHTAQPSRRAQWSLPLRPGDDLATVKAAVCARLLADPRVLREPGPRAFVREWNDPSRVLTVQAWSTTADQQAVQEELLEALGETLQGLRPPQAHT